jgi:hypothetical protein
MHTRFYLDLDRNCRAGRVESGLTALDGTKSYSGELLPGCQACRASSATFLPAQRQRYQRRLDIGPFFFGPTMSLVMPLDLDMQREVGPSNCSAALIQCADDTY